MAVVRRHLLHRCFTGARLLFSRRIWGNDPSTKCTLVARTSLTWPSGGIPFRAARDGSAAAWGCEVEGPRPHDPHRLPTLAGSPSPTTRLNHELAPACLADLEQAADAELNDGPAPDWQHARPPARRTRGDRLQAPSLREREGGQGRARGARAHGSGGTPDGP